MKIKEFFINCLKGCAIGISAIIPGVSGGTVAVILKIYDKILEAVTNIFKKFKESFLYLLPLLIGGAIGFIALIFPLDYGLKNIPLIVVTLFVGLILGGLPSMFKKVKQDINLKNIIIFILCLGFMIGICFVVGKLQIDINTLNFGTIMYLFACGLLGSLALVAPGISGSMMLMVVGSYDSIIGVLKDLMSFNNVGHNILILLPVIGGVIIGFFMMSYLMKFLLGRFFTSTMSGIIGLIIGSIFSIYYLTCFTGKYVIDYSVWMIIMSVIALVIGFFITFLLERKFTKE